MEKFDTIKLEFRNLPIGYYFIFNNKAFLKINDYAAIILFSYLEAPLFSKANNRYFNVNKKLEYEKPSFVPSQFEPNEIIDFVKKSKLKEYIHRYYQENRVENYFSEVKTGDFFFNPQDKKFYKKISYYNAVPIYKNKYGLDGNENINISIVTSANRTESKYNNLLYNGSELIKFEMNAWNIICFEDDFSSFTYESFDTERKYTEASSQMLDFISNIPEGKLVFISNSNNSNRITDLASSKVVRKFKNIYEDYPDANNILSSIGINNNVVENISHGSTLLMVSKKLSHVIHYAKALSYHKDMKFDMRNTVKPYILEYTYSYNAKNKNMDIGGFKVFNLDDKVYKSTLKEVTCRLIYDLPELDFRISEDDNFNIYDF